MICGLPAWGGFSAYLVLWCPSVFIVQGQILFVKTLYCSHNPMHRSEHDAQPLCLILHHKCKTLQVNNSKLYQCCVCIVYSTVSPLCLQLMSGAWSAGMSLQKMLWRESLKDGCTKRRGGVSNRVLSWASTRNLLAFSARWQLNKTLKELQED